MHNTLPCLTNFKPCLSNLEFHSSNYNNWLVRVLRMSTNCVIYVSHLNPGFTKKIKVFTDNKICDHIKFVAHTNKEVEYRISLVLPANIIL